ncbi:MAG: hypothetical protein R2724_24355 [Bryobacterales bacterium]
MGRGDSERTLSDCGYTFRQAAAVQLRGTANLAAEEICWGGMHSWKMVRLLELADKPNLGFQADMAHTLALHLGLQRARGPHPARRLRVRRSRKARRGLPAELPTRCGPGRLTFT